MNAKKNFEFILSHYKSHIIFSNNIKMPISKENETVLKIDTIVIIDIKERQPLKAATYDYWQNNKFYQFNFSILS